jgi:hypothetical protein
MLAITWGNQPLQWLGPINRAWGCTKRGVVTLRYAPVLAPSSLLQLAYWM